MAASQSALGVSCWGDGCDAVVTDVTNTSSEPLPWLDTSKAQSLFVAIAVPSNRAAH